MDINLSELIFYFLILNKMNNKLYDNLEMILMFFYSIGNGWNNRKGGRLLYFFIFFIFSDFKKS